VKLFWTPEAKSDRLAIYNFIETDNPAAAIALDEVFHKGAAQLVSHPETGRRGRVPETRELVVHRNYIVVYDLVSGNVRILRILHAAQRWPPRQQ